MNGLVGVAADVGLGVGPGDFTGVLAPPDGIKTGVDCPLKTKAKTATVEAATVPSATTNFSQRGTSRM
jgi:hypothetical protein